MDGLVGETVLDFEGASTVDDGEIVAAARGLELGDALAKKLESCFDPGLQVGIFSS